MVAGVELSVHGPRTWATPPKAALAPGLWVPRLPAEVTGIQCPLPTAVTSGMHIQIGSASLFLSSTFLHCCFLGSLPPLTTCRTCPGENPHKGPSFQVGLYEGLSSLLGCIPAPGASEISAQPLRLSEATF